MSLLKQNFIKEDGSLDMDKIVEEVQKMDLSHVFVFANQFSDEEKREIQPYVQKAIDEIRARKEKEQSQS